MSDEQEVLEGEEQSLRDLFPNLLEEGYDVKSKRTASYDCIAWAVHDESVRWDPAPGYYWPRRLPRNYTDEAVVTVFESLGFERCPAGDLEEGFEKLAIYSKSGEFLHVARQLPGGNWTSKLGIREDIEHQTLFALEGADCGEVSCFLKKRSSEN
jgi:hypothetical protein